MVKRQILDFYIKNTFHIERLLKYAEEYRTIYYKNSYECLVGAYKNLRDKCHEELLEDLDYVKHSSLDIINNIELQDHQISYLKNFIKDITEEPTFDSDEDCDFTRDIFNNNNYQYHNNIVNTEPLTSIHMQDRSNIETIMVENFVPDILNEEYIRITNKFKVAFEKFENDIYNPDIEIIICET